MDESRNPVRIEDEIERALSLMSEPPPEGPGPRFEARLRARLAASRSREVSAPFGQAAFGLFFAEMAVAVLILAANLYTFHAVRSPSSIAAGGSAGDVVGAIARDYLAEDPARDEASLP